MFPGCSRQRGEQFLPQAASPVVPDLRLRFCGMIQALVKSPHPGTPAEETGGVGRCWR